MSKVNNRVVHKQCRILCSEPEMTLTCKAFNQMQYQTLFLVFVALFHLDVNSIKFECLSRLKQIISAQKSSN